MAYPYAATWPRPSCRQDAPLATADSFIYPVEIADYSDYARMADRYSPFDFSVFYQVLIRPPRNG
jgi:hypothetical protein